MHDEILRFRGQPEQFFRSEHALERIGQRRQFDRQFCIMQQPAQVFQRVRHTLQEMGLAFVEASKTVRPQGLKNSHIDVCIVMTMKRFTIQIDETLERIQIIFEKLLAKRWRQIGLGVIEQRSNVILQRAFAATLIVDEPGLAIAKHDVARLKIAVEENNH